MWAACTTPATLYGGPTRRLPCSGGVGDQPAALWDVLNMIDGLMA